MPVRLIECLATTEALAEVFSDRSVLEAMLAFEVELAKAEARLGVVPEIAAKAIATAARAESFDVADLANKTLRGGTPGIPLSKALTGLVRAIDPAAARFVHWGATSQDVADTALVLLLKKSRAILQGDIERLESALLELASVHANTVMLGRTLMQPAPPVTFGLKAAGWLAAIRRSRRNLEQSFSEALILQFGGASGTLASLGEKGIDVGRAMAKDLGLEFPDAPWHTYRDRLARLVCACGVLTGSLGKMARDISSLMQAEVAEVSEAGGDDRGGSSTMPHKHNPIGCALTLGSAHRIPPLVATFLSSMVQEHERGVGGWQSEWSTIADVIQATGLALSSMAEVAEGLTVDPARMKSNINATRGVIFAERATILLGAKLGRDAAHKLLEEATRQSASRGKHLVEVLSEMPEVTRHLDTATLRELETPEKYLGVAEQFRQRLIAIPAKEKD
jgi:3-carboxy-cis,cis-muconate cycloisomerase